MAAVWPERAGVVAMALMVVQGPFPIFDFILFRAKS